MHRASGIHATLSVMSVGTLLGSARSTAPPLGSCRFCEKLAGDGPVNTNWTVVAETDHLVGVPSVGPLVPGWLLALPREHHLNFAEVIGHNPGVDCELAGLAKRWEKLFGPLTWFEHGPKEAGSDVGCSIDHAHMHLVPLAEMNLVSAAEVHLEAIRFASIETFSDIQDAIRCDRSYLYIRLPDGTQWLAPSDSIPSQSLRRAIAIEQGRADEWDWNDSPGQDLLTDTIARATSLR